MNKHKIAHYIIKAGALTVIIYFSSALAVQINLGGDVEYWITVFIALGVLAYGIIEAYDDTLR